MNKSTLRRAFTKLAVAIDRRRRWDQFPTPLSLALLMGIRGSLREHNLYDTEDAASRPQLAAQPEPRWLTARTVDGSLQRPVRPGDGRRGHPVRAQRPAAPGPARDAAPGC